MSSWGKILTPACTHVSSVSWRFRQATPLRPRASGVRFKGFIPHTRSHGLGSGFPSRSTADKGGAGADMTWTHDPDYTGQDRRRNVATLLAGLCKLPSRHQTRAVQEPKAMVRECPVACAVAPWPWKGTGCATRVAVVGRERVPYQQHADGRAAGEPCTQRTHRW